METNLTGQRILSAAGAGEVLTVFGDKVIVQLESGGTTTLPADQVTLEFADAAEVTDLTREAPAAVAERATHASQILAKLDHADEEQTNEDQYNEKQQSPMEISEKAMDVINDLIEINNDRVEGFEKAARDLEDQDSGLTTIFNKLAAESRKNAAELTQLAQDNNEAPVEGTSTSGAIHRAWLDVKSVFTGGDAEAILNECERGEDAIKAAYRNALDPENEIGYELQAILQQQQIGVNAGHDLIKSIRDQSEMAEETDEPVYQEEQQGFTEQPAYEGGAGSYGTNTVSLRTFIRRTGSRLGSAS